MADALLLQPPPGDLTGPYPALPYLKSYAKKEGFDVLTVDLGIEALHFLAGKDRMADLLQRAEEARKKLEARGRFEPPEYRRFVLLAEGLGLGLKPGLVQRALKMFQDVRRFYDYRQYRTSAGILNSFFRLLSGVHFPTEISASDYTRPGTLRSFENILAHRSPDTNPYVAYYRQRLWPLIEVERPAVVGLSMEFGAQAVQALVLGRMIKDNFPDIHVTMGGAYLSQWVLLMGKSQLDGLFSCTDSVVCGEGEEAFSRLLERVLDRRTLDPVPNLIFSGQGTADPRTGFDKPIYTDVESQPPPDFSDLDMSAYLTPVPVVPYTISRGCYWGKCVFCQNRYGDNRMRPYQTVPVEKAVEEMNALAGRHGSDHFNFSNDVVDPAYLRRLSLALIESGKPLVWNTDLRAEEAFDEELCGLMARAGLNSVAIGMESGCQKTLDGMDKGNRVETTRRVMKNLYDAGVAVQAMGIFGFPGETLADGETTVRFLEENTDRISYYVMGLLMVLPGSRMYENPGRYGVTSIDFENNPLMTPEPIWRSETRMSFADVNMLYRRLAELEHLYTLDDYPYVGGLSTNHGFLYYRMGPDILKRLRANEHSLHLEAHRLLGLDRDHRTIERSATVVPRIVGPYAIHSSYYPLDDMFPHHLPVRQKPWLRPAEVTPYLVEPAGPPLALDDFEVKLLNRINGRRSLEEVLKKTGEHLRGQCLITLMRLYERGLLEFEAGIGKAGGMADSDSRKNSA